MPTDPDESARDRSDAAAQRRWLIGIAITILFGSFGAVMAWLSYSDRIGTPRRSSSPRSTPSRGGGIAPAPDPAVAPTSAPEPSSAPEPTGEDRPGQGRGRPDP